MREGEAIQPGQHLVECLIGMAGQSRLLQTPSS